MNNMKTNICKFFCRGALVFSACAALTVSAQQRFGGGGFGGFGGGNNAARSGSSASGNYNGNGQVGSATISVDPVTHNIIVIADKPTADQISQVIASLDEAERQVLIKVVFLEVQRNDGSDIGIEGGLTKGVGNNLQANAANVFGLAGANSVVTNFSAMGQTFSSALSPSSTVGANGIYQLAGSDFQATLRAIANAGRSQVLSRPSILARDGQLAKIVIGQEVPLPTSVSYQTTGTSGSTSFPIVNISYTDVGIILNVTPFIGANSLVQMIIQPQISKVNTTQSQAIAQGVQAPYIDIRSADTVVVTPDAQPVVIGGLIQDDKSSTENKVPFLGDIPLIGNLFKESIKAGAKTELLMFLTPHIIQEPQQLGAMTKEENNQTSIIKTTVDEQELNRFLEKIPATKK